MSNILQHKVENVTFATHYADNLGRTKTWENDRGGDEQVMVQSEQVKLWSKGSTVVTYIFEKENCFPVDLGAQVFQLEFYPILQLSV